MKTRSILFLSISLGLVLLHSRALSQFSAEATVTTMFDDNVNNNYLQVNDKITDVSLGLAHDWETESSNTQAFYTGSLNYYSALTARTFHAHSLGLTYSRLFNEATQTLFTIGGTYRLRINREDYTFYDNTQFSAYANFKHYFAERVVGRASYSFRSVRFSELSDFNYAEHYGFIQGTFFLPTRTTVILETDIGTKIYSTPNYDSTLQTGSHGQGQRRVVRTSTPSVTQLIGIARVGQPVFDGTGLSFTTSYQVNVQKESRYLTSEYGTISDDELFDDHYGYEGLQASVMVTQLLPAEMQMRIIASTQKRNYSDRPAFDLIGNPVAGTREDTRRILTVQLEKRLESIGALIGLSYDHIANDSNDLFYDYTNNALTVRLSFA